MRKCLFSFLLCSIALCATAQDSTWRFSATLGAGYVAGENGPAFSAEALGGAQRGRLFLGAGVGVDYYNFRSVPLFLTVRHDLRRTGNTPFLYASGGPNFPKLREGEATNNPWEEAGTFRRGPFWEGGFGFSFPVGEQQALSLAAGYSYKSLTDKRTETAPCLVAPCPTYDRYFTYDLRRIAVRAAWRLR